MKYYVKVVGLLYYLASITLLIAMFFHDGQDKINYMILGILFLLLAQVHMLEQTILNNVIRPNKIVVNLNGETVFTQGEELKEMTK